MTNERIEDVQKFRTHQEKIKLYGDHFLERLQQDNPQRALIGRMAPEFCTTDGEDFFYDATFYLIGERAKIPRQGLAKLLLEKSKEKLKVLVQLKRENCFCYATILDNDLRDSATRILKELDEKSRENYFSSIKYSNEPSFWKFKQVKMPSPY